MMAGGGDAGGAAAEEKTEFDVILVYHTAVGRGSPRRRATKNKSWT